MKLIDADKLVEELSNAFCENCQYCRGEKCINCKIDNVLYIVESQNVVGEGEEE